MNKIIILITIAYLTISCSGYKVLQPTEIKTLKDYPIVYSLPKVELCIAVELLQTKSYKGPFADYCNYYLGMEPEVKNDEIQYKINNIIISQINTPDTSKTFCIISTKKNILNKISLTEYGLLAGINNDVILTKNIQPPTSCEFNNTENDNEFNFMYSSYKSNLIEIIDTTYKIIKTDSTSRRVPVYSSRIEEKDIETKASEAADLIKKLRKRKFRMMTGMDEVIPSDIAAEKLIDELNKMEKEYISLFLGEKINSKSVIKFHYTPEKEIEKSILFYFSELNGITNDESLGTPLYILCYPNNNTISVDSLFARQSKLNRKGLAYNIADMVNVQIIDDGNIYYNENILIPQFGIVSRLSRKALKGSHRIIICPQTGTLQLIGDN
ncbi:MAG: DUF4831 family protein [Bacteroidota bacterium]